MKVLKHAFLFLFSVLSMAAAAQVDEYPFASDIMKFKEGDKIIPPPENALLFAGSSSFTLWTDVQDYFPEYTIINRGFGGSTLLDQIRYSNEIILPYFPCQIIIYCGENDLAASDTVTPGMVVERFEQLFGLIRSALPDVKVTYVSMKPSPSRWHLSQKMIAANFDIWIFLESQENADFINIWDKMLNEDNLPDSSLFLEDMLHMNASGYKIWQKAIEPELIKK
jgi:lysophospholipase L1-like esterase